MDARAFDVFEDAGDHDVLAVKHGVDFDFASAHVLIDQQRRAGRDRRCRLDVTCELTLVVNDLHAAAAQHVRRTHEHRETDLARDRARFAERVGGTAARTRNAQPFEHFFELLTVFGEDRANGDRCRRLRSRAH